ncbi:DUF402 domain-containing protein [Cellulomonas wangsupingiae]|uniref:DUF402 domain-containing protein n=1 Tax=Cellulomonas wangsupingiae TaxID=2968085 RepID=A0ABY5K5B4_9CELL|nr:DUF402 domain-containing protein [Cellulomonas wangsupingiae]MCC2336383.1 DUF402 domain-containing protein [Cellulomonas wangsupingiae]UUI65642.1 DUF402 domain-containing protein [Cellulomonas wangsupingiae]
MSKQKVSLVDGTCAERFSWPVEHLGQDQHGTWLGARRGNPVRQPDGRHESQEHDAVWLVTEGAWWLPAFWFTDTTDLTIDICTPPTLDGSVWSFVDLELDLVRAADGRAGIVDQDEFDELALSGHLTDSQVATATEVARALLPLVQMEAEPFGRAARAWLQALRS